MFIFYGKKIDENKKVRFALSQIYGLGYSSTNRLCNILNIPLNLRIFELTENQKYEISSYIKEYFILDSQLKDIIKDNIQKFIETNTIRGFRHRTKLPVRGQRTHSNGRTRKKGF